MSLKNTLYKRHIQKCLYFSKELSCSDISILTEKSLPIATKAVNELIEEGIVIESGYANSTGGRRAQMYSLKPDLYYIVAVIMDQLVTRIALLDVHNNCVGEESHVDLVLKNNSHSLHDLNTALANFLQKVSVPHSRIVGIGIGMPGFIDINRGLNHLFLQDHDGSITGYLKKSLGLPVFIDNDSSLIALAEQRVGIAASTENAMIINIGWGVGLGMILNGKLFRGQDGFAGEFSHIPLFTNNKLCSCGKSGCLETETSMIFIAERAQKGVSEGRSTNIKITAGDSLETIDAKVFDAAKQGDTFAIEIISEAGYNIGKGVAILLHLLNPGLIVLTGRGAAVGKLWLAPMQQAINEHSIPKIAEHVKVTISTLGDEAGLIGAAMLVMEHFSSTEKVKKKPVELEIEHSSMFKN